MDVSVIIPFYSNTEWLYEAVKSIKEKNGLTYEIIIINDGSNEKVDFSKFTENRDKIKYFTQVNQGPGRARNFGIEVSQGEYISFLDSDDVFMENKLTRQLEFMRSNDLLWCHTSYTRFYPNGKEEIICNKDYYGDVFPKCLAYNPIATPTVMVKREALENPVKRFSEQMRYGQDGFLWCQLASKYTVGVMSEPLSRVRMRGNNATLKARNHLYVKANMYLYFKFNKKYINNKEIPAFIYYIFWWCFINNSLIDKMTSYNYSTAIIEKVSRFLYLPEYLLLKSYSKSKGYK